MVFRLDGPWHRVQVKVYDYAGTKWEHEPVKFVVRTLPQSAHPSTAFSKGEKLYYGTELTEAWLQVQRYAPGVRLPDGLKKYVKN